MNTTDEAREVIERTLQGPIETIWQLWTTKEGIESWYGPRGFRSEVSRLEPVEGGVWESTMIAEDPQMVAAMQAKGRPTRWPNNGRFTEVVPHSRLAFVFEMPTGPGMPAMTMSHVVELQQADAGVRMVFTVSAVNAQAIGGAARGWTSAFDRLAEQLAA